MRPAVTVGTALGTFKGVVPKPNRIGTAATGSLISFITGHDYILNSLNAPAFPPTSFKDCFCACFAFWKLLCSPTVKCKGDQGFLYKVYQKNKLKLISMKIKLILSGQTELSPPSRGYSKKKASSSYMALIYRRGLWVGHSCSTQQFSPVYQREELSLLTNSVEHLEASVNPPNGGNTL